VSKPVPQGGLVIRYDYLWVAEEGQGREEGAKLRPCAIVVAVQARAADPLRVIVCGITHARPTDEADGAKLPQKEFREPLLQMLYELGGSAGLAELREGLLPRMQSRLGEADYSIVSTGEPRWWNATCWERSDMVKEGLLRGDSPRGRWELSEDGRRAAARLANS